MTPPDAQADLNRIAESYVKLVLAVGQHDPDYVDAYYGPEPWKTEATGQARTLHQIQQQALDTQQELARVEATSLDPFRRLRYDYLRRQLQALVSRVELLG